MPKTIPLPPDETLHDRQPDVPQPSQDEPVTPPVTDKDDPKSPIGCSIQPCCRSAIPPAWPEEPCNVDR